MQACGALRLLGRGASHAYHHSPATTAATVPCTPSTSLPRLLCARRMPLWRACSAAGSGIGLQQVHIDELPTKKNGTSSDHEKQAGVDIDAGYDILLPSRNPGGSGPPVPPHHQPVHHYHPNLVLAYAASLQRLLLVLLSDEFKLTKKLAMTWRRVVCLAIELLSENQGVLAALVGLAWYTAGISLIGRATFQLIVFSPEALTPPWISVIIALQHALLNLSDFVMEKCALVFASFAGASVLEKILLVILSVTPLVALFAPMYRAATGASWAQAMFKTYTIINRLPGSNMVVEPNLQAHAVVNLAFFCGTFTFAVFLGIVSDEVKRSFQHMRHASYPTHIRGHTVVLNWTSDTIPLLKQLDMGRRYSDSPIFKRPIVVLAARDKAEMDKEVASRLRNTQLEIHTRFGNPSFPKHLDMVATSSAHTCIVLQPEGLSSPQVTEAVNAATAMALGITGCQNVVFQVAKAPHTVDYLQVLQPSSKAAATATATGATGATGAGALSMAAPASRAALASMLVAQQQQQQSQQLYASPAQQAQHPQHLPALHAPLAPWQQPQGTIRGPRPAARLLTMPDHNFQDRIMCQTSVQPGVLGLWRKLLQEGPNCFKLRLMPLPAACADMTYQHVRRSLPDCVVIGCMRNGQVQLNPDDSRPMVPGDQLVVVSYVQQPRVKPWAQQLFRSAADAASQRTAYPCSYEERPKHIIVAGWRESDLQDVTQGFADATPKNSRVTFILRHLPKGLAPPKRKGSCYFRYQQAENPTSLQALLDAGIKTADSVVLTGLVQGDTRTLEADSLVLSSLLQVQSAVRASGRTDEPHIIASVNHASTRQVIQEFFQKPPSGAAAADQHRVMWYDWHGHPQAPNPEASTQHKHSLRLPGHGHGQQQQQQQQGSGQGHGEAQQATAVACGPGAGAGAAPGVKVGPAAGSASPAALALAGSPAAADIARNSSSSSGSGGSGAAAVVLAGGSSAGAGSGGLHAAWNPLASWSGFLKESVVAFNDMVQQADAADAEDSVSPPHVVHMHTTHPPADASTHQHEGQMHSTTLAASPAGASAPAKQQRQHHHHHRSFQQHLPRATHTSRHPDVPNPEVFLPDDVRTALLAQVATQPDITFVVRQLLTLQQGAEFVLRDPSALNIAPGETLSFAEVAEAARQLKHTAVGYLLASGQLAMVLEPLTQHTFKDGDQVVLITTGPRS